MKKINQIGQLRQEQRRLSRRRGELKQLIHSDWIELREAVKLRNILKTRLMGNGESKQHQKRSWTEGLGNMAGTFTRRLVHYAENEIETRVGEGIESLLNSFLKKKK